MTSSCLVWGFINNTREIVSYCAQEYTQHDMHTIQVASFEIESLAELPSLLPCWQFLSSRLELSINSISHIRKGPTSRTPSTPTRSISCRAGCSVAHSTTAGRESRRKESELYLLRCSVGEANKRWPLTEIEREAGTGGDKPPASSWFEQSTN